MDGYLASMSRKDQSRWFGLIGFFDFLFKQFELQKQQQQQHLHHNFEEKSRKQKITKHPAPVYAFIEPCSDFMSLISGTCMVIIVIVMVSLLINYWLLFIIITVIRKLHCPALLLFYWNFQIILNIILGIQTLNENEFWEVTPPIATAPVAVGDAHHDEKEDESEEDEAGDDVDDGRGDGDGDGGLHHDSPFKRVKRMTS